MTSPDGLRCCHANTLLSTSECGRTSDLKSGPNPRVFAPSDGAAPRTGPRMHVHLCCNVTEIELPLSQCLNHHEVLLVQHPSLLRRDERLAQPLAMRDQREYQWPAVLVLAEEHRPIRLHSARVERHRLSAQYTSTEMPRLCDAAGGLCATAPLFTRCTWNLKPPYVCRISIAIPRSLSHLRGLFASTGTLSEGEQAACGSSHHRRGCLNIRQKNRWGKVNRLSDRRVIISSLLRGRRWRGS